MQALKYLAPNIFSRDSLSAKVKCLESAIAAKQMCIYDAIILEPHPKEVQKVVIFVESRRT